MAACWRRGTEAPSDANFCANCGAEVKAQARDLPVFAEPTTVGGEHVEAADPAPSRWLLLVALVLLGGLVGLLLATKLTIISLSEIENSCRQEGWKLTTRRHFD